MDVFKAAAAIEPDVFVQSTVNRASQILSKNISKEEKFEGENAYECEKCGKSEAVRTCSINRLPPYLIVTINRFIFN